MAPHASVHQTVTNTCKTHSHTALFNMYINLYTTYILSLSLTHTHTKPPPEINFIYLSNKEICCIFKTCYIFAIYFPQNAIHFIILSFSVQIICFSQTNLLKRKDPSGHLKVNLLILLS